MIRGDLPGPRPELKLYPAPEGLDRIDVPQQTLRGKIRAGYLRNLFEFLTKSHTGVEEIRRLAEETAHTDRTLEVLQVGNVLPLKTLYCQGNTLRVHGDYLVYGPGGKHRKPDIRSTIIADDDYVGHVIEDPSVIDDSLVRQHDILYSELAPIMAVDDGRDFSEHLNDYLHRLKGPLQSAYDAKKASGEIVLRVNPNPVDELRKAYREGKRYDLIFPEVHEQLDRMNYLQMVQATLNENGCAFVPMVWWSALWPRGTEQITYFDDTVITNIGEIPVERYLAEQFPEAYSVVDNTGIKMLVIHGTNPPVQLPDFDVRQRRSWETAVSLQWKVKAKV